MLKQLVLASAVTMICVPNLPASAADSGFYLGAGVGRSRADVDTAGFTGAVDKTDTAWNLYAGYQFNKNFALEAGYVDLGDIGFNGALTAAIPPFPAGTGFNGRLESQAWTLSAVGLLPFSQNFSGYGKLGFNYNKTKLNATLGGASGSASDNSTDYTLGLGLKYDFNANLALRGGWDRYRVGSDQTGGKGDVDVWQLALQYKF